MLYICVYGFVCISYIQTHIYVCTSMHTWACVCHGACMEVRGQLLVVRSFLPLSFGIQVGKDKLLYLPCHFKDLSTVFSETESLTEPGGLWFSQVSKPASLRDPPDSAQCGVTAAQCPVTPGFLHDCCGWEFRFSCSCGKPFTT